MHMNPNFDIEQFLSLDGYDTEVRKSRRKTGTSTQEFFTPYSIVKRMCDKVSDEDWCDPSKTFLEPCAGNFQFVCYIIYNRILHGVDWQSALETCFAVELMEDNVQEGKERVINLLKGLDVAFSEKTARDIMERNFVVHDFFTWNFTEWREMTEEEIKLANKKSKKK